MIAPAIAMHCVVRASIIDARHLPPRDGVPPMHALRHLNEGEYLSYTKPPNVHDYQLKFGEKRNKDSSMPPGSRRKCGSRMYIPQTPDKLRPQSTRAPRTTASGERNRNTLSELIAVQHDAPSRWRHSGAFIHKHAKSFVTSPARQSVQSSRGSIESSVGGLRKLASPRTRALPPHWPD